MEQKIPKTTEAQTTEADEPSETELLAQVRVLLDTIEPEERPVGVTGKGRFSPMKTVAVAIRIPAELDADLKALKGPRSYHVERAILWYLKILKAVTGSQ